MKFHELDTIKKTAKMRKGRGISAGKGKTTGRGTKGQAARTGFKRKPGFEGGQTPLVQRIPKLRGFTSIRKPAQVVYTENLNIFKGKVVTNQTLADEGFIETPYHPVKIILRGELKKTLAVKVQKASKSSIAMITKAGGSFTATETPRPTAKTKTDKPIKK